MLFKPSLHLKLNLQGAGLRATGEVTRDGKAAAPDKTFQWAAGRHTAAALEAAKHPCDLVEEDATLLRLDAEGAGLGSATCGPGPAEEFEVGCRETGFRFLLERVEL